MPTSAEVRLEADLVGELCSGTDRGDDSRNSNECDSWQEAGEQTKELAPDSVFVEGSNWASWFNNTWSGTSCSLKSMEKESHKLP